ncbi:MAG TPA: SpoIIE family protein phosphatase [Terriglobia bacterium]|nr:SpoIIE family protein phosphatase [Terriglobia bacterium]
MGVHDDRPAERISRVIFEYAAKISRERDITKLITLNADLARDLVGADRCSLWLLDESTDELWTKVAQGLGPTRIPAGQGLVGLCVGTNESIIVNDTASDEHFLRRIDTGSGYRTESVLAVPLRVDGRVIGALQALNKPGGFSQADSELLGLMASYSASEIHAERLRQEAEAARLLRRELDIARDVQTRLLPQEFDPVAGIEYAGFCRAARSVGGDYYDFLELPGGLFGFTVGDVSGKGVPAAVLMAGIHTALRAQLLREPLPVSKLMNDLNAVIYKSSSQERYTTLFCGVFDAERSTLSYVSAGHVPPMVLRGGPSAHIERLSGSGYPAGLLPFATYEERTAGVGPGDLVICFSDGISDAVNAQGEMWEDEAIKAFLRTCAQAPVEEITKKLIEAVDGYSAGMEQFDDMTVVALRLTGRS